MHRLGIVVLALAVILVGGARSASAGPGDGNSGASDPAGTQPQRSPSPAKLPPGGGGVIAVGIPATCWWEQSRLYRGDGSMVDLAIADEFGTAWTATWTGSGNTGGTLAPLQRNTRVEVPVAESQSVVIGAR